MQSLKSETDQLFATILRHENTAKDANKTTDQYECDIRDLSKKIQTYEVEFDETNDKLTKTLGALEEKLKAFKNAGEEVSALSRRIMLMEEEAKKADTTLADTVTKLAMASKEADGILKKVKHFEAKTMRNEVEIVELAKTLRETTKMASDNEQKLDELTRKLGVQEDECKRATERAEQ